MAGADVHADIKETGEHKVINGFNATQMLMTMEMSGAGGGPPGMKMQMEMEIWVSADVPGVGDLRSFYQRNMAKFPWASLGEGTNPGMKAAMIDLQKKLAQDEWRAGAGKWSTPRCRVVRRCRVRRTIRRRRLARSWSRWPSRAGSRERRRSRRWLEWARRAEQLRAAGCRSPSKGGGYLPPCPIRSLRSRAITRNDRR